MVFLFDNDFILCLATFDLLAEALELLNITPSQIQVLPSAKYKIRKITGYSEDGIKRALDFIETVDKVPNIPAAVLGRNFAVMDGIDIGEKLLLATALDYQDFGFATGDKTFLRRLAITAEYEFARVHLARKVVCLEHMIRLIMIQYGSEYVKQRVVPYRNCNTSIKAAFGSGMQSTHDNIMLSLNSRIRELDSETNGMLVIAPS